MSKCPECDGTGERIWRGTPLEEPPGWFRIFFGRKAKRDWEKGVGRLEPLAEALARKHAEGYRDREGTWATNGYGWQYLLPTAEGLLKRRWLRWVERVEWFLTRGKWKPDDWMPSGIQDDWPADAAESQAWLDNEARYRAGQITEKEWYEINGLFRVDNKLWLATGEKSQGE